jgi:DNA-binding SARP family transcriptional activator
VHSAILPPVFLIATIGVRPSLALSSISIRVSDASPLAELTPRFRLRTLGGLSIEGHAGVPAVVNQRKRLASLAVLAASGSRGIGRDRLLLLLWPESTTDRARGALYQLLYVVRQAFGEQSIVGTDELRLDPSIVGSDVEDFSQALARGDLAAAVELYAGPFLDAVHLPGAPELEAWLEQKRQELSRNYESALSRLATQAMERGDNANAIALAERLAAANPLSERATVLLMEALAAAGDVSTALERARAHASTVQDELGVEVDASVSALAAQLRFKSNGGAAHPVAHERSSSRIEAPASLVSASPDEVVRRPRRAIAWVTAAVAVVVITPIAVMRWPRETRPEVVVVADFATAPADSQIADALTDVTRRVLNESRALRPASEARMGAARRRVHMPPGTRLTLDSARKIAVSDGIRTVVVGELRSFGGGYAISLRLVSAASGEVLATAEKPGIATTKVFDALGEVTSRLRRRAGDDLEAIRAQPSPLALTSVSLEAMADYVAALRLPRDSLPRKIALLQKAVDLDSTFAMAIGQLAFFIDLTGRASDSIHRALLQREWNHREGLTEYEQMRVEIAYKYSPNGIAQDPDKQLERLRQTVDRYPNPDDAAVLGDLYTARRDLAAAEHAYGLVAALDSMKPDGLTNLAATYLRANRISKARRTADEVVRRFPTSRDAALLPLLISYADGRHDRIRETLKRMIASTGQKRVAGYTLDASLDLLEGRVTAWERRLRERDSLPDRPRTRGLRHDRLLANYWVLNRPKQGLRNLEEWVAADTSLRFNLETAEFFAQFGEPDSARAMLAARGTSDRTVYLRGADTLPVAAWIDLAEGRPGPAVTKFRESLRFAGGGSPSQNLRDAEIGLAFERAGMPDSALASYEHYLNAPPVWDADIYKLAWVLEHAATLYDRKGDRRRAKTAYDRLAVLWKDADPELQPLAKQALARSAALRRTWWW